MEQELNELATLTWLGFTIAMLIFTINLGTNPVKPPCDGFYAWGIEATDSPNWTMDGQSMHTSFGSAAFPDQNSWNEQVTTGFKEHAWQVTGTNTVATKPSNYRTWRSSWSAMRRPTRSDPNAGHILWG